MRAESQGEIALLIAVAVAASVIALRTRLARAARPRAGQRTKRLAQGLAVAAVAVLALLLRDDDFALLLLVRGADRHRRLPGPATCSSAMPGWSTSPERSFFGVGGYTAAVLSRVAGLPDSIVLLAGGAAAALSGTVLLLPILRTRGHYAALITIAFALLFRTFLEVNDCARRTAGAEAAGDGDRAVPLQRARRHRASFEGSFYSGT